MWNMSHNTWGQRCSNTCFYFSKITWISIFSKSIYNPCNSRETSHKKSNARAMKQETTCLHFEPLKYISHHNICQNYPNVASQNHRTEFFISPPSWFGWFLRSLMNFFPFVLFLLILRSVSGSVPTSCWKAGWSRSLCRAKSLSVFQGGW